MPNELKRLLEGRPKHPDFNLEEGRKYGTDVYTQRVKMYHDNLLEWLAEVANYFLEKETRNGKH